MSTSNQTNITFVNNGTLISDQSYFTAVAQQLEQAGSTVYADAMASAGTLSATTASSGANFILVVQVPLPIPKIGLSLAALFSLPTLAPTVIPAGLRWLLASGEKTFERTVQTAIRLVRAIPEASVTIVVKVGPVVAINIQLIAEKVPVDVPIPDFVLSLPDLAVGLDADLTGLIPVPPPVIILVPVPVPIVRAPIVGITGGNVSAEASVSGLVPHPQPALIVSPIRKPVI